MEMTTTTDGFVLFCFGLISAKDLLLWSEWIVVLLISLLIILYIINLFRIGNKLITTRVAPGHGDDMADQYYYLPSAAVRLQVCATVQLRSEPISGEIVSARLVNMQYDASVTIIPDPASLLLISYHPDIFSDDNIKITTNSAGLMQSMTALSEDRISSAVQLGAQDRVVTGTAGFGPADAARLQDTGRKLVTVNVDFHRVFQIDSAELYNENIERIWKITPEGISAGHVEIDASFVLRNSAPIRSMVFQDKKVYRGILTRPLKCVLWKITSGSASDRQLQDAQLSCMVPDISRVITVPTKRRRFVKNDSMPQFNDGMLVENHIRKPSEAEGFVSIPLNIIRAVFSIPSQLLHFRITRNNQLTDYSRSAQELIRAESTALTEKQAAVNKKLEDRTDDLRRALDVIRLRTEQAEDLPVQDTLPKLGKLPADMEEILSEIEKVRRDTATEPAGIAADGILNDVRNPNDWTIFFKGQWGEYRNRQLLTCVPAAAAHLTISWCSVSGSPLIIPSETDVLDAYKAVSGFQESDIRSDKGCSMYRFMKHWRDKGLAGLRISRFVPIRKGDPDLLRTAVYWFGGCMIGLNMPASAREQISWEMSGNGRSSQPGSWGGHAVAVIGYNSTHFIVISWGRRMLMSHDFYRTYNDEGYIALSGLHWTGASGRTPTEPSRSLTELDHALTDILRNKF